MDLKGKAEAAMKERIDKIGGELTIESKPGRGTQIWASWSEQINK